MRNPLLDSVEGWSAARKGHIPFWKLTGDGQILLGHTGDVNFLIDMANRCLGNMSNTSFENTFGYTLGIWMKRFVDKGFTTGMVKELRQEMDKIRFFHFLNPAIPSRGKPLPHWEYSADMEDFSNPRTTAAYAFSVQMTVDGFVGLKCCKMDDCQKFFNGRSQAKWCSKACGSKHRVTQKRKRDRNE